MAFICSLPWLVKDILYCPYDSPDITESVLGGILEFWVLFASGLGIILGLVGSFPVFMKDILYFPYDSPDMTESVRGGNLLLLGSGASGLGTCLGLVRLLMDIFDILLAFANSEVESSIEVSGIEKLTLFVMRLLEL